MSDAYRTPSGEVYEDETLDSGRTCGRCGTFVPGPTDLRAIPENMDYATLVVKDYEADEEERIFLDADLCPECRDALERWYVGGGADG